MSGLDGELERCSPKVSQELALVVVRVVGAHQAWSKAMSKASSTVSEIPLESKVDREIQSRADCYQVVQSVVAQRPEQTARQ